MATGKLTALNNLDNFHVWPAKYRHWTFELIEDASHQVWISTKDLRLFYDRFPGDKELARLYFRSMIYAKDVKCHYISVRAMQQVLHRGKLYSFYTEILKFLDWFERNVSRVAEKKRSNERLDETNAFRQEQAELILEGPLPLQVAPARLEDSTTPLSHQERWALEQTSDEIRKVFHPEARAIRTTWRQWMSAHARRVMQYVLSFWRGERNLFLTFVVSAFMAGLVINGARALLVPESLDWTRDYVRVLWGSVLILGASVPCALWYLVSMSRATWRSIRLPGGKLWASATYALLIPLAPAIATGPFDRNLFENWWDMVSGHYHPVEVYADSHLGRIVLKGPIEFGSSEALEAVLDKNPKFTLIELESPGGYVIEGMRMSKLIAGRKMDTVSFDLCASACTDLFVSGQDRYLGPDVQMGFHRSGTRYGPVGSGWNASDYQSARYLQERGTSDDFIQKALTPSIREIWWAPHKEMYTSGYANLQWSERKQGY